MLDLAAGTGKLARALRDNGLDVVAVEPLAELREVLGAELGSQRVLAGVAEQIPLPDGVGPRGDRRATRFTGSITGRAGGDSARARPRWRAGGARHAHPTGTGASWAHEVGQEIMRLRPAHPHFDGPPWQDVGPRGRGME